jgi:ribosome recycling factor
MAMVDDVIDDLRREMGQTLEALRRELSRMRTGRASTALLEGITVDYYGAKTPLNQLATLGAPEPRLLVIQPYDRSVIGDVERAILQSDLGLVPNNDGKLIRIPIPELTEERRRDLVKHMRKVGEDYRVGLRNHRRDAIDMLKTLEKDKEITEDDLRRAQEKVQEVTKEFTERLEKVLKVKEEEIMEV